jgi:hypothetical protein
MPQQRVPQIKLTVIRRHATAVLTATESWLEYVLPLPSASADGKKRPPVAGTLVENYYLHQVIYFTDI